MLYKMNWSNILKDQFDSFARWVRDGVGCVYVYNEIAFFVQPHAFQRTSVTAWKEQLNSSFSIISLNERIWPA